MGAKFFSHGTPGRTQDAGGQFRVSEIRLEGRDRQQALVLGALHRAAGAPVSYAELREAGVELPASVVSELELAGVAIERCVGDGAVGVRLDPLNDPAARSTPDPAERPIADRHGARTGVERRSDIPSLGPRRTLTQPPGPGLMVHQQGQRDRAPSRRGARPRNRCAPGDGNGNERSPGPGEAIPRRLTEARPRPHRAPGRNCARVRGRRDVGAGS